MTDANDIVLLREFVERQLEPAFAEIVRRHLNLVYSVALRFVRDSEDAQDVAQAVFILLAQKAGNLRERSSLTGWLYETTRFTAMKFIRTRARRAIREQEAIMMQSTLGDSSAENLWRRLEPLLEEAMSHLNEKDRVLIALHFFENKSHAETAVALGIAEWATRKRVARAVEKLRVFFGKRGVAVPAAVLVAVISANSVHAAPAALAKTVTVAAVIKGTAPSTTTIVIKHEHRGRAAEAMRITAAQNSSASAQNLQGRWKGTNTAHPGQTCTVNISNDQIEYRGTDPNDWLRGTFVLNDSANPPQLDIKILEPANGFILCIYQTNGDNITIAAAEHGSARRPASFAPGRQVDVLALQRD